MKGFLSFIILWFLHNEKLSGKQISGKIRKLKGEEPSPGTIYPALKELSNNGFVDFRQDGKQKIYFLTQQGHNEIHEKVKLFKKIFSPICSCRMK
jgi:PadR family transcriptional regulator, regulatory protein PadR